MYFRGSRRRIVIYASTGLVLVRPVPHPVLSDILSVEPLEQQVPSRAVRIVTSVCDHNNRHVAGADAGLGVSALPASLKEIVYISILVVLLWLIWHFVSPAGSGLFLALVIAVRNYRTRRDWDRLETPAANLESIR